MIKRRIDENGVVADLFHDGSGHPKKAIVLLGGSEGGKTFSSLALRSTLNDLISQGYTLLSLAYFKNPGLPSYLEEIPLEYFEKAFAWLATQPEVISKEIAIIGGSKGAEVALLLGGMNPSIKAVVAMSPSYVVWQGITKMGGKNVGAAKSSWTYQGIGLPFVPYGISSWNFISILFQGLLKEHERALQNTSQVEDVVIPVEKIQGPILLMSGTRDRMWPSTDMCVQIMSRLAAKGFVHPYEHIAYNTGHTAYMMKKDCWRVISGFLKDHYV